MVIVPVHTREQVSIDKQFQQIHSISEIDWNSMSDALLCNRITPMKLVSKYPSHYKVILPCAPTFRVVG